MSGPAPDPSAQAEARKRQRTASFYPRRRNLVACNVCRGRKSKCDNVRPSCGFCLSIGADCVYEEMRSEYSNYDSASLHIINRLEAMEKRMEERFDSIENRDTNAEKTISPPHRPVSVTAAHCPTAEAILEWPVFDDLDLRLHGRSLALMHEVRSDVAATGSTDEASDFLHLEPAALQEALDAFLQNVHSKNPVLDPQVLPEARSHCVQEGGFDNKPHAALAAIACGLGMVSTAYGPAGSAQHEDQVWRAEASRALAERCFSRGRAILGLQPPSLLSTQCLFFCGVYEMFTLRPVDAWLHFSQASLQLRLHIQSRTFSPEEYLTADGRLIQRLYWSCMQSESELANELRISSSGLRDVPFPYAFPNPPDSIDPAEARSPRPEDMQSWMYYLSETSLRRICDEVCLTLHNQPPSMWMQNMAVLASQAEAMQEKAEAWIANIPVDLRIDEAHIFESHNELGLHIRSRYLMCRYWILQPFVYFMIHATQAELLRHRMLVEPLGYAGLEAAMGMVNDATHHHRHHGTWYTARLALGGALTLLAAAKINSITMPSGWLGAVRQAERIMAIWSPESRNLQVSLEILQRVRQTVHE